MNFLLDITIMPKGQGNAGGWPSTTGNPSGGGRSNAPSGNQSGSRSGGNSGNVSSGGKSGK